MTVLMCQGTNCVDVLMGRVVPLRLGYIGVINRSQKALPDPDPDPDPDPHGVTIIHRKDSPPKCSPMFKLFNPNLSCTWHMAHAVCRRTPSCPLQTPLCAKLQDISESKTIRDALESERAYFMQHSAYRNMAVRTQTRILRTAT